jgi:hypothetical protein
MPRIPDPAPVADGVRTLADFMHYIGDVPAERIMLRPPPGMANADDVLRLERQENRLCELVDGVVVAKSLGYKEMTVAANLLAEMEAHAAEKKLGVVTGPAFYRLGDHVVRVPAVAFCATGSFRSDTAPGEGAAGIVPQLVAEIDDGSAPAELERKLSDYFAGGVKLVWVIHIDRRAATAWSSPKKSVAIPARGSLDAGRIVRGFTLPLARLFDNRGAAKRRA